MHHSYVGNLLFRFLVTPFQVISKVDDLGVERQSKKDLLLEASINFLDCEAIFRDFKSKLDFLYLVLQFVDC